MFWNIWCRKTTRYQDSLFSSLTSPPIHIKQVQTTEEFDNTVPLCYHSPLHHVQVSVHLCELRCSSFTANLCVFNQILFKWVSFQSELLAWETPGKLNSCSCQSISEKLPHRQKGFKSTGHNQDKKHVTDPLSKYWRWDTSFVAHWQHQTSHYIVCLNCLSLSSWSMLQLG